MLRIHKLFYLLVIVLLIMAFYIEYTKNIIHDTEHFGEQPESSSKFDISTGASSKYGWGKAEFRGKTRRKKKPRPPHTRPPHTRPPGEIKPNENKYIINDFRGGCDRCDIVKHSDIDKFVLKSSIPPSPDMSKYILKNKMPVCPDMSKYILKSEVPPCPNMSKYVLKSEVPPCPDVFRHLSNDGMRGNIYSCNVETPLLPQRCSKADENTNLDRNIRNHPDFHKYKMKNEYKTTQKEGVCSDNIHGFVGKTGNVSDFSKY